MSDDREREHCERVALAHSRVCGYAGEGLPLDGSDGLLSLAEVIQRERAAAAAEARGQDAALLDAKAARHWKAAEEHEEFGDDETAILQESVAMCLEEAAKAIRALRGGGR